MIHAINISNYKNSSKTSNGIPTERLKVQYKGVERKQDLDNNIRKII